MKFQPFKMVQDDKVLIPGRVIMWQSTRGNLSATILHPLPSIAYKVLTNDVPRTKLEIYIESIKEYGGFDWSPFIIGIDLGNTIVRSQHGHGSTQAFPDSLRTIRKMVQAFNKVVIVSRVNPAQEIRARQWIKDSQFEANTGIPIEDVHFCENRSDKGRICKSIGVTHFIDDRPEVMHSMPPGVRKILYGPSLEDQRKHSIEGMEIVQSWKEVAQKFEL